MKPDLSPPREPSSCRTWRRWLTSSTPLCQQKSCDVEPRSSSFSKLVSHRFFHKLSVDSTTNANPIQNSRSWWTRRRSGKIAWRATRPSNFANCRTRLHSFDPFATTHRKGTNISFHYPAQLEALPQLPPSRCGPGDRLPREGCRHERGLASPTLQPPRRVYGDTGGPTVSPVAFVSPSSPLSRSIGGPSTVTRSGEPCSTWPASWTRVSSSWPEESGSG